MQKLILTILLFSCMTVFGQVSKREKLERLKAHKIAFITDRLGLTPEEAKTFWPVYNEFFRKKEMLNNRKKAVTRELQNNWESYSDDRKTELVDKLLVDFKFREAQLEKEYLGKLKKVLPIDKIIRLYRVETQFKTFLLKQIKNQANKDINRSDRNFQRR